MEQIPSLADLRMEAQKKKQIKLISDAVSINDERSEGCMSSDAGNTTAYIVQGG